MDFLERVNKGLVLFDGGFGTMIQKKMELGELPEMLNLRLPEDVKDVHLKYLNAGADVIETNTLNANCRKISKTGHTVDEVIGAALANAKKAVEESGKEAFIALSMGSTGVMMEPFGDMTFEEATEMYSEMAFAGKDHGADLILIETMTDLHEIKAAVFAAKKTGLPVAVTVTFMENGKLLSGADVKTVVCALEGFGVDILGMNCGLGPKQMSVLMDTLSKCATKPVLINPNAGLPKVENGVASYEVKPDEFAQGAFELVKKGARLIGGCCGTTPDHIKELKKLIDGVEPSVFDNKPVRGIISGSKICEFGKGCEICDITADDDDDMLDNALDTEASAVLINGADDIAESVKYLQETVLKPFCLFDEDIGALKDAALKANGRLLIGVAGGDSLDAYIEAAQASGACLAVDSKETAQKAIEKIGADQVYIYNEGTLYFADMDPAAEITKE